MARFVLVLLVGLGAYAASASAGFFTYTTADVGGFVLNSASTNPGFLAAIGSPDEFLSFSTDKFGNLIPVSDVIGTIFSNNVTFSSAASGLGFGGLNSTSVNGGGSGSSSEIGPASGFNGVLIIDFLANGNTASIVGFGPVVLETNEQIRVYNQSGTLAATFGGVSNNSFTFFGVQGTAGDSIGRIELDGSFYAIQDLQFNLQGSIATPLPPTALMGIAAGLIGIAGCRFRRT